VIEWRRLVRAIEPHPGEHFKDKIIAVMLAFLVWFAVNTEESYPQIFPAVPVSTTNLPPDLALAADVRDTVTVWVSGPQRDLQRVTSGMLSPRIDLSTAEEGENIFPISAEDLNAPRGVSVTAVEPSEIRVELEHKEQKSVPVSPVTGGEPAEGFQVVGRSTTPDQVVINGPRSAVAGTERIPTSTVDVSGRRESFSQRIGLEPPEHLTIIGPRTVELRIEITERAVTARFNDIAVEVVNSDFRVAVNPPQLSVLLGAPPSVLEQIDIQRMRLVIDAEGLQPRAGDYLLEPTVQFEQEGLAESIEVIDMYPQRRINVRVYSQPARQ
jgi:YbbR domain-containing protein